VIDTSNVVFLDTETTGLDPDRNEIWDLAFIRDGKEYEYKFSPDLTRADPIALKIGHFYERTTTRCITAKARAMGGRQPADVPGVRRGLDSLLIDPATGP
jgi:hypothetical protein